jgi:hypothetical protein
MACNSEGGRCICPNLLLKMPHTCKFYFTCSYSLICTCGHVKFQRPLVSTDSHTKHINEIAGRTSNARGISAKKFVRTYVKKQRQFLVAGNEVPAPSIARFCPLRFLIVTELNRSHEGVVSRMSRKIRNNRIPTDRQFKKFSCSDGRTFGPVA